MDQHNQSPQPPLIPPAANRIQCTVLGCSKMFNRKEHLTRHLKSHDPQRQYACHLCGRRYARSDVLKRHIEQHSDYVNPTRTSAACTSCHERKLKCDDATPCRSCVRNSTQCIRPNVWHEGIVSAELGLGEEGEANGFMRSDHIMIGGFSDGNEVNPVMPVYDHEPTWLPNAQEHWPLQQFRTGPAARFATVSDLTPLGQWQLSQGEAGHVGGPISATVSEQSALATPITNDATIQRLPSESRHAVLNRETPSHVASHSPASSRPSQSDHLGDLHDYLGREQAVTNRLIQVYFAEIQPCWPILHAPTFDAGQAGSVLIGSMVMLAAWLEGNPDHKRLASSVFADIDKILLNCCPPFGERDPPALLSTLQAFLLCVVYTICRSCEKDLLVRAIQLNGNLVSLCRVWGIFSGEYPCDSLGDRPEVCWVGQEQFNRLAYAVLRADAYLSALADHPPSVRYHEIRIPLPKSPNVWASATEDERRRLQWSEPAGREKAIFCFLMRDVLDVDQKRHMRYRLTEMDYHLTLCAFQGGIWEAIRTTHSCDKDEISCESPSRDSAAAWSNHLGIWRIDTEEDCQLRHSYFSASRIGADSVLSPFNLIFWHLSALSLHAPLGLFQDHGCCMQCRSGSGPATYKNKVHLRRWVTTPSSRAAVWNAAQLYRIVVLQEGSRSLSVGGRLLNPLAIPGLLRSAIVICTYAYHVRACPVCTGGSPIDLVDILGAPDDNDRLLRWRAEGVGLADWSPLSIPVCQCKVGTLAKCFRQALATDERAEAEFMSFLGKLAKK